VALVQDLGSWPSMGIMVSIIYWRCMFVQNDLLWAMWMDYVMIYYVVLRAMWMARYIMNVQWVSSSQCRLLDR
jgi:hypothetical protein